MYPLPYLQITPSVSGRLRQINAYLLLITCKGNKEPHLPKEKGNNSINNLNTELETILYFKIDQKKKKIVLFYV